MKTINVIRLANVNVSVLVLNEESTSGSVVVRDNATDNILSAVTVFDSKPLFTLASTDVLDRIIYIQSYNSENLLSDLEREQVRDLIRAGNTDAKWLEEGRFEYFETDNYITGGMILEHDNGKMLRSTLIIRCPAAGVDVTDTMDLTNGPINFTAHYMNNTVFFEGLSKAAMYNLRNS